MSALMGPYEASLVERYAAVRKRLSPPPAQKLRPVLVRVLSPFSTERNPVPLDPGRAVDLMTPPSWKTIAELVALKHGLRLDDLTGPSRAVPLCAARAEAIQIIGSHMHMSLPAIGRRFNRDHTTILHAIRKGGRVRATPPKMEIVWTTEMADVAKTMWDAGGAYNDIAAACGVSKGGLWNWFRKVGIPCRNGKLREPWSGSTGAQRRRGGRA